MSHRTKWQILSGQLATARLQVARLESEMRGMEKTSFNGKCITCDEFLATEKDFAIHFKVANESLLNLGYCPNSLMGR